MTTPAAQDDSYPASWRPKGAPPFDDKPEPTEAEKFLAGLSDEEFTALTARVRGGDR
jgi:hypothetical protein